MTPMHAEGRRADLVQRWWYHLAMYTGVRAWRNHRKSRRCRLDARLARMHGRRIEDEELGAVLLWVHPRRGPARGRDLGDHAMISLRLVAPPVGRLTYQYLCSTSHFGCAHAEVALYRDGDDVVAYGVRNIASANARRVGLRRLSDRLRLTASLEEERILQVAADALGQAGLALRLAPARQCVDLSVDDRLLHPAHRARVREDLLRRYARLARTTPVRVS